MIRFVKHSDIHPEKWDNAVLTAQQSTIFATYDLLDSLTGNSSWNALVKDDYLAVMPLPERAKGGIHYIYTPFFIPQLGIFSSKNISAQEIFEFFNTIPKKYKQVDLLLHPQIDLTRFQKRHISLVSHDLDLNRPYEILQHDFSQNTKRNIKDANKHSLTLVKNPNILEEVIQLFVENKGGEKIVHYGPNDYRILARTAKLLLSKNALDIVGVNYENQQLIAGAFFVRDQHRLWFWFSGRNTHSAESKPMFFLLDEYIRAHAEQPLVLDFNGSLNENVARLYKGFGGQPYSIPMANYARNKAWQALFCIYNSVKR